MQINKNVKISYYELILTENCNLRCKYCFDDYFDDRANKKTCNQDMDISLIDDIFNFILETYDKEARKIDISFFGGEPLMNWNFIKEFVLKAKKSLRLPIEYSINTNLTLATTEKINFMIHNNFKIVISIDGDEESNDVNRISQSGKGSWKDVIKWLPQLVSKSKELPIQLLMVVNKRNYKNIYDNYKFCTKVIGCNTDILFDYSDEMTEEYLNVLEKNLIKIRNDNNIKNPITAIKRINSKPVNNYCFRPDDVVTINPTGKLFFCHQLVPKLIEIEDDFSDYYGDIYKGYYNNSYYKKMKNRTDFSKNINEECNNCPASYWCAGGCIAGHYWKTKSIYENNDGLCKVNLLLTKVFKEF